MNGFGIKYILNKLIQLIKEIYSIFCFLDAVIPSIDINKYIKKCLGINATKENCNRVKDLLLGRLGAETYQEIPIDVLNSKETFDKILDICIMISNNEGQIQMGLDL